MKRKYLIYGFIFIISLFALILLFINIARLSIYREEYEYYKNKENYIVSTGIVNSHYYYNETLCISFSNMDYQFSLNSFRVEGENVELLQVRGVDDILANGVELTIVTAPKYFGDGYKMQIVGLSVNGRDYLEFEEGYDNLMSWYKDKMKKIFY